MNVNFEFAQSDFDRFFKDRFDRLTQQLENLDVNSTHSTKEWLSNSEAMSLLGVSRATIQRYRREGRIPYSKIGAGSLRYRRSDLLAFLEAHLKVPEEQEVQL